MLKTSLKLFVALFFAGLVLVAVFTACGEAPSTPIVPECKAKAAVIQTDKREGEVLIFAKYTKDIVYLCPGEAKSFTTLLSDTTVVTGEVKISISGKPTAILNTSGLKTEYSGNAFQVLVNQKWETIVVWNLVVTHKY